MEIKLAQTAGFCFGVNRAVDMLYKMVEQGEKVCTLGPIIHNPQVIDDLKAKGVVIADSPDDVPQDTKVVIRTHGVEKQILDELSRRNIEFCDATCPFVKKIHKIINDRSDENSTVLIAGDENHPEVQGIRSYVKGTSIVFRNCDELSEIQKSDPEFSQKEIIVVSQTTFNTLEWEKCIKFIKKYCTNALIFDTICNATNERQEEAMRLAESCDVMIIVGGRQSSNTAKLKAVCENCCQTYLIETAAELSSISFNGVNTVGITAGASTPAAIIKEVHSTMENTNAIENVTETAEEVAQTSNAEEMNFEEMLMASLDNMSTDQKVRGIVTSISPSEIQVDIGRKQTGYIPADEYSADPTADPTKELNIGDEINLIIMKTNDQEGTIMLSKKRYDAQGAWDKIEEAKENNEVISGTVTDVIKGGLIVVANGVRIFVPASLATASRNDSLDELLKTKVDLKVIEVKTERGRKKAVGSIKAVIKEARKAAAEAFWAQAEEGQVYNGTVKSLTNYGAFVDIGGIDGMVHISEMSWKRIKHPSEVLSVGQEIEVYIKSLDKENKKISLGYKKAEDNPWEILRRNYPVDTVIESEIVGMTAFGAFATVIPGIDGLIHISQIADKHISKPQDVLSIGEKVTCKITAIDFEKNRVSLSIRALIDNSEAEEAAEEATEEVAEEAVEAEAETAEEVVEAVADEAPVEE